MCHRQGLAGQIAESYIQLRNCIEHHYGMPKSDIYVMAYSLSVNVQVDGVLKAGEALTVNFQQRTIKYNVVKNLFCL